MKSSKKKILVIEDDEVMQKILTIKFNDAGFIVVSAMDGREGLEAARKEKPDLIVLDLIMPVMDGIACLKEIKDDPAISNTPIIVLTNLNNDEMVGISLEHGITDYLVKADFTPDEILKKINEKFGLLGGVK